MTTKIKGALITGGQLGQANYPHVYEPELDSLITRYSDVATEDELNDYNDLLRDIKVGQGLTLGISNLNTLFNRFYCNCAHAIQATDLDWSRASGGDKTRVGTVLFEKFVGIKSDGSSYCTIPDVYPTSFTTTNHIYFGGYLIEDVNNSGHYMGKTTTSLIGYFGSFSADNLHRTGRNINLTNTFRVGLKRHMTARRVTTSQTSPIELYGNGNLITSTVTSNWPTALAVWYELCRNFDSVPTDFLTANLAFSYRTMHGITFNVRNFHFALRRYLIRKGITGL